MQLRRGHSRSDGENAAVFHLHADRGRSASEYASLSNPNIQGKVQKFSPGVGSASTGWVRPSVNGETFDGSIIVRQDHYIAVIKVGGVPNIDAPEKTLVRAGEVFTKP
jgi:hypothetical protein